MRKSFLLAGTISFFLSVTSFARNPSGEFANYKLDRSRKRTSSVVRKGTMKISVGASKTKDGAVVYPSVLAYDVTAMLAGRVKGDKVLDIPSEFFDPTFIVRLRKERKIDQIVFKLEHLGRVDVETQNGAQYPGCDIVRAYDVNLDKAPKFATFIETTLGRAYLGGQDDSFNATLGGKIKNAEMILYMTDTLPVMGAAKIDMSGTVQGFDVKAGFDYVVPSNFLVVQ